MMSELKIVHVCLRLSGIIKSLNWMVVVYAVEAPQNHHHGSRKQANERDILSSGCR